MDNVVKMIFGSHLYGTNTENSDRDYKGIFIPSIYQCIQNEIPKMIRKNTKEGEGKNTSDDIDEEAFSLQQFMKLGVQGEMFIIDMIHAPKNMIIETSNIWKEIQENRSKFYSKNLSGYIGYIKKQTAKYSVKGSRLNAMEEVVKVLNEYPDQWKLTDLWSNLPKNEYCSFIVDPKEKRWELYECCGKKFQPTITVSYCKDIIQSMFNRYGERALLAKQNKGIDWKAISHAFRAGFQLKELYTYGDLKFPLKDAEFIKEMKIGKLHYVNDGIGDKLDELFVEVNELSDKSELPEKPNVKWMREFIENVYKEKYSI